MTHQRDWNWIIWAREGAALEMSEMLCSGMQFAGVSRAELADRLHMPVCFLNELLDAQTYLTVGQAAEILFELGLRMEVRWHPIGKRPDLKLMGEGREDE